VRATLPRLPQLERWLARGERQHDAGDWRAWLQRSWPVADPSTPPASIAAAAVEGVSAQQPVWLATPVHLVAGLDTVRLHPAGLLQLTAEEQRALALGFSEVFAGSGWSLHPTGRRDLLLSGGVLTDPGAVRTDDPAGWLGADPRAGLASGPHAKSLRQLGSEIEMWLHGHRVNEARAARGLPGVTALWIWSGGAPPAHAPPSAATARALACADDLYVDGLARLGCCVTRALPDRWPSGADPVRASAGEVLALCPLSTPGVGTLENLERDWIGPAYQEWRSGGADRAALWLGGQVVTVQSRWAGLWRAARAIRPWWEYWPPC
jgi:hypothetical protein